MRKILLALMCLVPMLAWPQYYVINTDSQDPVHQYVLDGTFCGNTPYLRQFAFDNGIPINMSGWSMTFSYKYSEYDTNGIAHIPGVVIGSNQVDYLGATNVFFMPGSYFFSIDGINASGYVKTFARGTMTEYYNPATSTNIINMMGQLNISWWSNNVGAAVASNTANIAVLRVQFDATSNATTAALGALTTNLAAEVSRATNAEAIVSNSVNANVTAEYQRATNAETIISNSIATAVAVETVRATNAEAVLQGNIDAISISSSNAVFRYAADNVSNVWVLANGQGVTNVLSGTTHTFTVPTGVKLFSACIKWDNSLGTSFTVVMAEDGMNTTALNRRAAVFQAYRTDTDPWAPIAGASCRPSLTLFDHYSVIGLATTPNTIIDCEFSW